MACVACGSSSGVGINVVPARSCGAGAAVSIPAAAPYDLWTWVGCTDTACANGSPTGMAIQPHPGASTTLIYLEAGGACWDYEGCVANPTAANLGGEGPGDFLPDVNPPGSVFDRSVPTNPFRDANFVFIPYCTGDLHGGDKVTVYEGTPISHTGFRNFGAFLATLAPTFATSPLVVLSGSSAGGFGALFNYARTRQAFASVGPARVVVLSDAGTTLRPPYFTTALEQAFGTSWNLYANLPPGCDDCSPGVPGGGIHNLWGYYARHPPFVASFLTSTEDQGISWSFSPPPGDANLLCAANDPSAPCGFNAGLQDLLDGVLAPAGRRAQIRSFVVSGYQHTFMQTPIASVVGVDGTRLTDFLAGELDGNPSWTSSICDGASTGGCVCNAIANSAPDVLVRSTPDSAPAPEGGALTSGVYRCVSVTRHQPGATGSTSQAWRETLFVEANPDDSSARLQETWSANRAPDTASTTTVTVEPGGALLGDETCPTAKTVRMGYTSEPGKLTLYEPVDGQSVRELVFERATD